MAAVSAEQIATRRRALGRKLALKASDLRIMTAALRDSPDCDFLDAAEGKSLAKQLDAIDKIAANFDRLQQRLEGQ